jgi:DNA-binding response OmpR family regulator
MQAQSPGELATLAKRPIRILVVDDSLQEQQILKLKLEALGANVIQVRQGRIAITSAQTAQPDVIILDMETADMPGLEVLRNLKSVKSTSSIPVICISNCKDDAFRMRALRLNADWYLAKPFRFSEMLARLRYHAQEIAAAVPERGSSNFDELRRGILRASVDTLTDIQDIRKALHGLRGYVGADDYYLNSKLEICFRNLMRIEARLREFREMTGRQRAGARLTRAIGLENAAAPDAPPLATETPDVPDEDGGTHGGGDRFG